MELQKIFVFLALSILNLSSVAEAQSRICKIRGYGPHHIEIQRYQQSIHILGWSHPGPNDHKDVGRWLYGAAIKGIDGDCEYASKFIQEMEDAFEPQISSAKAVLGKLESIDRERSLYGIGIEATSEEMEGNSSGLQKMRTFTNRLVESCPSVPRQAIQKLLLVLEGPGAEFILCNQTFQLLAVSKLQKVSTLVCVQ